MDLVLIVIGVALIIFGLLGCFLPVIPGPPLAFISLVLMQFTQIHPFSSNFIVLWAILVILVTALDYFIPIWGTKFFGGTKYGSWGSTIGLIVGMFAGPFGIIAGPFIGALVGELIGGSNSKTAFKSAIGSFAGFITGTFAKIIVVLIIAFYFFRSSYDLMSTYFLG